MGKKSKKRSSKARGANAPRPLGFTGEEDGLNATDPRLKDRVQREEVQLEASMAKLMQRAPLILVYAIRSICDGSYD
jgi:hypothetical protein